jgi:Fe2+ transport system protein FeoA
MRAGLLPVVRLQQRRPLSLGARPCAGEAEAIVKPAANTSPAGSTRLRDLPPGAIAQVVEIDASVPGRRERLQAYGLAPGRKVEVVQHAPVTVIRVERIDLALEAVIASAILVSTGI